MLKSASVNIFPNFKYPVERRSILSGVPSAATQKNCYEFCIKTTFCVHTIVVCLKRNHILWKIYQNIDLGEFYVSNVTPAGWLSVNVQQAEKNSQKRKNDHTLTEIH